MPNCLVCEKEVFRRGHCVNHYYALRKHGNALHVYTRPYKARQKWLEDNVSHTDEENCLIWPFALRYDGYADGNKACRDMCELAHGPRPTKKHHAAHSCGNGNKGCVNPHHLRWATAKENSDDTAKHGRRVQGDSHGGAKITESDAKRIFELRKSGVSFKEIMKTYGISKVQIWRISNGKRWSHLGLLA